MLKTASLRSIVVLWLVVSGASANAQIKTQEELKEELNSALLKFVEERDRLPSSFAAFGIGTMSYADADNVPTVDIPVRYLFFQDKSNQIKGSVFGYKLPKTRELWEVYCRRGDQHKFAYGSPNHWGISKHISPESHDRVQNVVRNIRKGLFADPYFLSLSSFGNGLAGHIDDLIGLQYLFNSKFLGGEILINSVVGSWRIDSRAPAAFDLIFDNAQPDRPSRVIWRRCDRATKFETRKRGRMFAGIETEWKTGQLSCETLNTSEQKEAKKINVPVSIESSMYAENGTVVRSIQLQFCWIGPGNTDSFLDVEWDKIDAAETEYDRRRPFFEIVSEEYWKLIDLTEEEVVELVTPRFRGCTRSATSERTQSDAD